MFYREALYTGFNQLNVRVQDSWEDWIISILKGIEETAADTIHKVKAIKKLLEDIGILK